MAPARDRAAIASLSRAQAVTAAAAANVEANSTVGQSLQFVGDVAGAVAMD